MTVLTFKRPETVTATPEERNLCALFNLSPTRERLSMLRASGRAAPGVERQSAMAAVLRSLLDDEGKRAAIHQFPSK